MVNSQKVYTSPANLTAW